MPGGRRLQSSPANSSWTEMGPQTIHWPVRRAGRHRAELRGWPRHSAPGPRAARMVRGNASHHNSWLWGGFLPTSCSPGPTPNPPPQQRWPATAAVPPSLNRSLRGNASSQPRMAETLAAIARDSGAAYQGEIGGHLVAATRGAGGVLDLEDLADYHPKDTPLHEIRYRGWRVLAPGLPTVGSLQTLLALQILSRFEPETIVPGSARHLQLITAAVRATYDIRARPRTPRSGD